jgi:hypothetical protein
MPATREKLIGLEFDFLAIDRDGHVALFATAGYGPIPEAALTLTDDEQLLSVEDVALRALAIVGAWQELGRGAGKCQEWRELGSRGLFVFDWKHREGPYELVVSPSRALNADELTAPLRRVVSANLPVCFAQVASIESLERAPN